MTKFYAPLIASSMNYVGFQCHPGISISFGDNFYDLVMLSWNV
jgi:hypothetical protein